MAVGVVGALAVIALRLQPERTGLDGLRIELAILHERTTPESSTIVARTEPVLATGSAQASWEIVPPRAFADYARWVSGRLLDWRLGRGAGARGPAPAVLAIPPGEMWLLAIEPLPAAVPPRARLTVRVMPDGSEGSR